MKWTKQARKPTRIKQRQHPSILEILENRRGLGYTAGDTPPEKAGPPPKGPMAGFHGVKQANNSP